MSDYSDGDDYSDYRSRRAPKPRRNESRRKRPRDDDFSEDSGTEGAFNGRNEPSRDTLNVVIRVQPFSVRYDHTRVKARRNQQIQECSL